MNDYSLHGTRSKGTQISSRARREVLGEDILPPGCKEAHPRLGNNSGLTITKQVDVYVEYEDDRGIRIPPRPLDFASAKANMRDIGLPF